MDIRKRAPSRGAKAELLLYAAKFLKEFDMPDRAEMVAKLGQEFAGRERAERRRTEEHRAEERQAKEREAQRREAERGQRRRTEGRERQRDADDEHNAELRKRIMQLEDRLAELRARIREVESRLNGRRR